MIPTAMLESIMATQHNLSKFMGKMHGDGGTSKKGKIMLEDEKKKRSGRNDRRRRRIPPTNG